jgi:hypothetical protein
MDDQLIALYHRHVATAFDRQLRMADFLQRKGAGKKWEYDIATATLAFGKVKFEAPLLGSHAEHNNSWLWAWSNRNLKLTVTNRALGDAVRVLVHRLGVHALAAPGFSLEPLLGPELTESAADVVGILLAEELGYDGYYTAPYEGGRATILVRDDRLKFAERHPLRRVITVFPQVIATMPVYDHKAALTGYAKDYGLAVADAPGGLKVTGDGGELTATFDDRKRLTELKGTVAPEEKKSAKAKKPPQVTGKAKPAKPGKKQPKVTGKPKKAAKKPAAKPAKNAARKSAKKSAKPAGKAGKRR